MNSFKELDAYFQLPKKNIGSGLVAKSCPTLATTWTVTCQAPLSMELLIYIYSLRRYLILGLENGIALDCQCL